MKKILFTISLILCFGIFILTAQTTGSKTALDVSGGSHYADIPDAPSLNPINEITVEAWINSFSFGINAWTNNIVNKEDWDVFQAGYTLRCGDNGKLSFNLSGATVWREAVSASLMQINTWYHVVGLFDGDSINLYINGELVATELYSGIMTPSAYPVRIGEITSPVGGQRLFDGIIDELRIWNTALDVSTIRDWMCQKITPAHPDYASLGGCWRMDEGSGTTIYDFSPNANNGVLINNPLWVNSGASIGDNSVHVYAAPFDLAIDYQGADSLVLNNVTGNPDGIHLISFDGSQNSLNIPPTYNGMDTTHYWSVFMLGGTTPSYDLTYYYSGGALRGACGVGMLGRVDNSVMMWNDLNATHNVTAQTLMKTLTTSQEISIGFTGAANIYTSDPTIFCDGDSALLVADSALSYQWFVNGTPIPGAINKTYSAYTSGDYFLVAVVGTCIDTSYSITINVYPMPNADAGTDGTICPGNIVTLTASGGVAFVWNTNPPQTTASIIVNPTTQTTYYVSVVDNICIDVDSVTVFMAPLVDLGSDTTINPGANIILDAGANYITYLWSDGSSGQYLIVNAAGTFWVQVAYPGGCVSSDTIVINIGYRIEGNIVYKNAATTPINNTKLILTDDVGNKMDSLITAAGGDYLFANLSNGYYHTIPICAKPWGGVNSTDALAIMKHFVGLIYLYGLNVDAGDVNNTSYVNSADALMVQKRYLGMINSFPVGDWVFENNTLPLQGVSIINDFYGLCYGDVNGSYIPPLSKLSPSVYLESQSIIDVDFNEIINLPLTVEAPMNVAAISLELFYPEELIVIKDVSLGKNSNEEVLFHCNNGILRISWYDIKGVAINANEVLLNISVRLNNDHNFPTDDFHFILGHNSEFADSNAQTINDVKLNMPKLQIKNASKENYLGYNHPNPLSSYTQFEYGLAEPGFVCLQIFNVLSEQVAILVNNNQEKGIHKVNFDASVLKPGNYFYTIEVSGNTSSFTTTRWMQVN
ncbi:MAG: hypothetical protein K8S00_11770 [Bacteroidales bacterium]|nr:hypothetical protein [Bacteroidales bacterium]